MPASASSSPTSSAAVSSDAVAFVVDVEVDLALGEDGRGQVGERDAQVPVVERDADRRAGAGVEREERRRAPGLAGGPRARAGPPLHDEPARLQLADDGRDRRAREARDARQLASADGPASAERVDDPEPVVLPHAHGAAADSVVFGHLPPQPTGPSAA
jgi:hypothetical protein